MTCDNLDGILEQKENYNSPLLSAFSISVVSDQPWSENIKWKITEINNS